MTELSIPDEMGFIEDTIMIISNNLPVSPERSQDELCHEDKIIKNKNE